MNFWTWLDRNGFDGMMIVLFITLGVGIVSGHGCHITAGCVSIGTDKQSADAGAP